MSATAARRVDRASTTTAGGPSPRHDRRREQDAGVELVARGLERETFSRLILAWRHQRGHWSRAERVAGRIHGETSLIGRQGMWWEYKSAGRKPTPFPGGRNRGSGLDLGRAIACTRPHARRHPGHEVFTQGAHMTTSVTAAWLGTPAVHRNSRFHRHLHGPLVGLGQVERHGVGRRVVGRSRDLQPLGEHVLVMLRDTTEHLERGRLARGHGIERLIEDHRNRGQALARRTHRGDRRDMRWRRCRSGSGSGCGNRRQKLPLDVWQSAACRSVSAL